MIFKSVSWFLYEARFYWKIIPNRFCCLWKTNFFFQTRVICCSHLNWSYLRNDRLLWNFNCNFENCIKFWAFWKKNESHNLPLTYARYPSAVKVLRIIYMDWFLYDNGLRHERVKYLNQPVHRSHIILSFFTRIF